MKNKVLEIHFKDLDRLHHEVVEAIDKKRKLIQPENHIYFGSIEDFRGFFTIQKLELLIVIAQKDPKSIYELAQLVGRQFPAVQKDCSALEAHKFIKLIKEKNGKRELKKPTLSFGYSCIAVFAPKTNYQIEFKEVA